MQFTLTVDAKFLGVRSVDLPDSGAALQKVSGIADSVLLNFEDLYPETDGFNITVSRKPLEADIVVFDVGVRIDWCNIRAAQRKPNLVLQKVGSGVFKVLADGESIGEIDRDFDGHACWTHGMAVSPFPTKEAAAEDLYNWRMTR